MFLSIQIKSKALYFELNFSRMHGINATCVYAQIIANLEVMRTVKDEVCVNDSIPRDNSYLVRIDSFDLNEVQ